MFKWIKTLLTRNPCKECDYYHKVYCRLEDVKENEMEAKEE